MTLGIGPLSDLPLSALPAVSGGSASTGSASITLDAVTVASAGALAIKADASITLAAVTLSSTSALAIQAAASNTLGAVTVSSDATLTTVSTARPDGGGGRSKAVKESRRAQYQKRNDQIMLQWRNAELEQTTRTKADEVVALPRKAVEAAIQSLPVADHPMARAIAGTLPAVVQVAYAPGMVPPDQSQLVRALTVLLQREIARQQAEADEEDDIEMLLLAAA